MRWTLLAVVVVALVALAAAGGHKDGKQGKKEGKESRTLDAKRAEFKESHAKEQKKCHGKKCSGAGAEKYSKGKNKRTLDEAGVPASQVAESADGAEPSGRSKREAMAVPDETKPSKMKGKKVPSESLSKGKKVKKNKKSEPVEEPVVPEQEQPLARDEAPEAKKSGKKSKRSADEAALEEVTLSEKASKGKKKKATEAELGKKKPKKAKKVKPEEQQEGESDVAADAGLVNETADVVKGAAVEALGPPGLTCADDDCANEE